MKSKVAKFNLLESVSYILDVITHQDFSSIAELQRLISMNKFCCRKVETLWVEQLKHSSGYKAVKCVHMNHFYVVTSVNGDNQTQVYFNDSVDDTKMDCQCGFWNSTHIPCRHIVRVMSCLEIPNVMVEKYIPCRWNIKFHPLYNEALRRMGVESSNSDELNEVEHGPQHQVELPRGVPAEWFLSVNVPKTKNAKFQKLHSLAMDLVGLGSKKDSSFRVLYAMMEYSKKLIENSTLDTEIDREVSQLLHGDSKAVIEPTPSKIRKHELQNKSLLPGAVLAPSKSKGKRPVPNSIQSTYSRLEPLKKAKSNRTETANNSQPRFSETRASQSQLSSQLSSQSQQLLLNVGTNLPLMPPPPFSFDFNLN